GSTAQVEVSRSGIDSRRGFRQYIVRDISARRKAEQRQREQTVALSMLSESAAEFLSLPAAGDEIDRFIGSGLRALLPDARIALSEVVGDGSAIVVKGVWGIEPSVLEQCKDIVGFDPVGRSYPFLESLRPYYEQDRLVELKDGPVFLADETIPSPVLERLARLLNVGKSYTRGLMRGGRLVGAVHIILPPAADIDNPGTVEAFIRQASIALHRRTVARELIAARENAERASEAKSQFLANTSHEIRTPMNAIVGMAELALARCTDDEQRQYLESIRSAAFSLLDIIDSILDLSKIEAGRFYLENMSFDVRGVVETAYQSLALRAEQKELTLVRRVSADVPKRVVGDPTRVRQVLVNLLSNAVKFTRKGGVSLDVEAREAEGGTVCLRFVVTDSGIGIPREKLEAIFDSFVQADGSTTRLYGGSGLGLTISRQLARMMNGDIHAHSEPGKGSTFVFEASFVRAPDTDGHNEDAAVESAQPPGKPVTRQRPPTVLVAEDNDLNRRILTKILTNWNAMVLEARNGEEAVALAVEHSPDLVLMDVQMPLMDGLEATRRIRTLEHEHTPIIALTAHAMRQDRERCLDAGMDDYLSKPYRPAQVLSLMQRHYGVVTNPGDPSTAPERHFDEDELRERLGDDPEILAEALRLFVETADTKIQDMRRASASADFGLLAKAAHSIRGIALTISAPRLAHMSEHLETECRRNACAEPTELVHDITAEMLTVVDRVRERLLQLS
ncbi:MAG: response regulator, partial [Chitinivibrionales bacterium]|nr:response regulator [Chitinivibrionales bacterium]